MEIIFNNCKVSVSDLIPLGWEFEDYETDKIAEFDLFKNGDVWMHLREKNNKLFYTNSRNKEFYSLFEGDSCGINTLIMSSVLIRSQLASVIKLHYRNIYVYLIRYFHIR